MLTGRLCYNAVLRFAKAQPCARNLHWSSKRLHITEKYNIKVQKVAQERGLSLEELKQSAKIANSKPAPLPEAQLLRARIQSKAQASGDGSTKAWVKSERRDNSPVKSLTEFMDVTKILRTPHTSEQVSALWTVYHASRSSGTGRGYLSASVPATTYESLVRTAKSHSSFVVPLMRQSLPDDSAEGATKEPTYEFFFMQWMFHAPSPLPTPGPLDDPLPADIPQPALPLSTVLFTPLLEYKTRTTFATPHLVLTLYPDLSASHGIVLLRGELTPSPGGGDRYLLGQQDAQLLALGMQRFYLASGAVNKDKGAKERADLLHAFNEQPNEFRWEDLLKHADPTS